MSLRRNASYFDERARPPLRSSLSRKSSLKYPCAVTSGHARHTATTASSLSKSCSGQTSDPSPSLSWNNPRPSRRQPPHLIIDDVSGLEFLKTDPAIKLSRRHSRVNAGSTLSQRPTSCSTPTPASMRAAQVQRWEGGTRTVSDWDGLRRDPELWFDNGDCLVHLYARGQSRRGPSFCVPFEALTQFQCGSMFSLCFAQVTETPGATIENPMRVSNTMNTKITGLNKVELFIPAPEDASREDAFRWHITTRNFFAYVFGKSLVGEQMGQALVSLQERMHLFRSGRVNNHQDFLAYIDNQGYRAFVDCPDYALATLYYAEHYKLRDVWIDAFAHCVGMNEILSTSSEFAPLSSLTKALIMRAYLEMDIHLGRITAAVRNFLEDDVSPAHLGLSDGARNHVDRFRSFLHGFYVEKFGYWPPPKGLCFPQAMFKSLCNDFQNLYDYLVDADSTAGISSQKPATGGICVLQNIESFDNRHNFLPLPHPLPLLPNDVPLRSRTESQKSLRTLTLGSKQPKTDIYLTARAALTVATNNKNVTVSTSSIVQAYKQFERQWAQNHREEKVSITDARKVRWILIYGTLQYLVSALRTPKEVRDTATSGYPLCCLITEQSSWQLGTKVATSPVIRSDKDVPEAINDYLAAATQTPESTIQPDCQTQDYFTHTNTDPYKRPVSVEIPAPLRISQPARMSSVRSCRRLSRSRSSSRRNSVQLKSTARYKALVSDSGNVLNESFAAKASASLDATESHDRTKTPRLELDCNLIFDACRTPLLASKQVDEPTSAASTEPLQFSSSSNNSIISMSSPTWSDAASATSSSSSIYSQPDLCVQPLVACRSGVVESSDPLGGLISIDGASTLSHDMSTRSSQPTLPITPPITHGEFNFGFDDQCSAIATTHQVSQSTADLASAVSVAEMAPQFEPRTISLIPSPKASISFDDSLRRTHNRTTSDQSSRSLSAESLRSISLESLRVAAAVGAMSPLRSCPSSRDVSEQVSEKQSMMDIFSALELKPGEPASEEQMKEEPIARTVTGLSETSPSILNAIPPSIKRTVSLYPSKEVQIKSMPYSLTAVPQAKAPVTLDSNERGPRAKMTRRLSFWRR